MDAVTSMFEWVHRMLTHNPMFAIGASFVWGILSVLLSPCHLSSIPLAIGYINGNGKKNHRRAFFLSLLFSSGILFSLIVIGIITAMFGRMLGDTGSVTIIIIGVILILVGVSFFEIITIPEIPVWKARIQPGSTAGALILGILFGTALGPCTFGFMMPVLSFAFQKASSNVPYAVTILTSYALGHSIVIIFAGTFINWVQNLLNWEEHSKGIYWFRRICGLLIIGTGVYLITGAL